MRTSPNILLNYNLRIVSPVLAKEWHPTKNGKLTPRDVTPGSDKKVWWKCRRGHKWQATVSHRNKGTGCPYCSSQAICKDNCLKTVNPTLAREWHPTLNGDLTPRDVAPNSKKKAWWRCKKSHEWQATISNRNKGNGCPYCGGQIVCKDNCLQNLNLILSCEWHPTKNKKLTPMDVMPNSHRKVWWKCKKGHEWQATVGHRNKGRGCPYCAGHRVCKENCLKTIRPDLAKEWNSTKNGKLTPKDVTPGSAKKVWWRCKKGHEWQAVISNRNNGRSCPYCGGKAVCKDNCLQTVNPTLAQEWHPTLNGNLTPKDVTAGSRKRVWWRCNWYHEWQVAISDRKRGRGCPYCRRRLQKGFMKH